MHVHAYPGAVIVDLNPCFLDLVQGSVDGMNSPFELLKVHPGLPDGLGPVQFLFVNVVKDLAGRGVVALAYQ